MLRRAAAAVASWFLGQILCGEARLYPGGPAMAPPATPYNRPCLQ